MDKLDIKFEQVIKKFQNDDFLMNRGLGNEVGIHVFQYQPIYELEIRNFIQKIIKTSKNERFNIIHVDLFEIFIEACDELGITDDAIDMEKEEGSNQLLSQFHSIVSIEEYISRINKLDFKAGKDIIIISGIGRVYPMMRAHLILNNIQHILSEVPVVLFYPGTYDSQTLTLFGKIFDNNYYRAFSLI